MGCTTSTSTFAPRHRSGFEDYDYVPVDKLVLPPPESSEFQQKYQVGTQLGSGTFGLVFQVTAKDSPNGELFAMKALPKPKHTALSKEWSEKVQREVRLWRRVSSGHQSIGSAHVLALQESYMIPDAYVFVMEYADATLWEHLTSLLDIHEGTCAGLFAQMLHGLGHVHHCAVVHRDVKNSNFMVRDSVLKIIDFGLATDSHNLCCGAKSIGGNVGTAPYMSPEMVSAVGYDLATDIWSLGVVAYTFLCGCFPHMPEVLEPKEMMKAIKAGQPGPDFQPCCGKLSSEAREFLKALLARNPNERPSADMARQLPFVVKHSASNSKMSLRDRLRKAYEYGAF